MSDQVLAVTPLSAAPARPDAHPNPEVVPQITNVRWIVLHIIEETATHSGHLEIARELLDGLWVHTNSASATAPTPCSLPSARQPRRLVGPGRRPPGRAHGHGQHRTSEHTNSLSAPSPVSRATAVPDPTTTATSRPVPANSATSRRARAVFMRRA
jgi:Protein of unknown function (DUF664)